MRSHVQGHVTLTCEVTCESFSICLGALEFKELKNMRNNQKIHVTASLGPEKQKVIFRSSGLDINGLSRSLVEVMLSKIFVSNSHAGTVFVRIDTKIIFQSCKLPKIISSNQSK